MNKVIMIGHLARDIELRYTQSQMAIGKTAIAVTRKYTLNGEKREEMCFIDLTFFWQASRDRQPVSRQRLKASH